MVLLVQTYLCTSMGRLPNTYEYKDTGEAACKTHDKKNRYMQNLPWQTLAQLTMKIARVQLEALEFCRTQSAKEVVRRVRDRGRRLQS